MINFSNIQLTGLAIHRVSNKHRAERNFIAQQLSKVDEKVEESLMRYFLKPMKRSEEVFRFQHEESLEFNEIYSYVSSIFEDPENLLAESANILIHLYRQSNNPNIKSGDVFVAQFSDIVYDDELVNGIGIFKAEQKNSFLTVEEGEGELEVEKLEGINIEKLDKGCLILNTAKSDGYRLLSIDSNNYDTEYWVHNFLNADFVKDDIFHTRNYMDMVNTFSAEVVAPATDKKEQIKFLTDSVDYFTTHETFNFDDFAEKVIPDEKLATEFKAYQNDYALNEVQEFDISKRAVKTAKRKIKSNIKLDTKIQIRLDFNNPESSQDYLEKGFDEEREMYYYKVYFNEELES